MILNDLVRDRNYEIVVTPFNSQGPGPSSSPTTVYVGEAVPTGEFALILLLVEEVLERIFPVLLFRRAP